MTSFCDEVQRTRRLDEVTKHQFSRIQAEIGDMAVLVGANPRNIEHLVSLIDSTCLARPDLAIETTNGPVAIQDCSTIIRKCITAVYSPPRLNPTSTCGELLTIAHATSDLTLITTNYDMNIEIGASSMGIPVKTSPAIEVARLSNRPSIIRPASLYTRGINIVDANNRGGAPAADVPPISLYKMHGSVNWFHRDGVFCVEDRVVQLHDSTGSQTYDAYLGEYHPSSFDREETRVIADTESAIVAPSVLKPRVELNALREQWVHAGRALNTADALWFIGYSFPESDSFMKYFFASSLHHNTNLRQIVIIDPDAYNIVRRSPDLLASSTFGHLVTPMPVQFAEVNQQWYGPVLANKWRPSSDDDVIKRMRKTLEAKMILEGMLPSINEIRVNSGRGRGRW